jgi:hypothetical protein
MIFDIWVPNTFIDVAHPAITSGLIILPLPAEFVLLGLIREDVNDRTEYFAILLAVSTLGYFHMMNSIFIVAFILLVIFGPPIFLLFLYHFKF